MKSKPSERKMKREKIEERIRFFINSHTKNNCGNILKNINDNKNKDKKNSTTLKDSFVMKEKEKEKIINNHEKKNINISSLSTQIPVTNELNNNNINNKKENQMTAIKMNKDIRKYGEPRFKLSPFEKLAPKFYKGSDISGNLSQNFSHEITTSEIEMLEIDEKLPQKKNGTIRIE